MDVSKAIKDAPTDVLCEAARTLQKAHDFVEVNEFSMGYGAERGETSCCFIGSVRQVAGEHDIEPSESSEHESSEIALLALDDAAQARGYKGSRFRKAPGGLAEATIVRDNDGISFSYASEWLKKPVVLETYRLALREMHEELQTRDDVPIGV